MLCQVKSSYFMIDHIRSGYVRLGLVRSCFSGYIMIGQIISG